MLENSFRGFVAMLCALLGMVGVVGAVAALSKGDASEVVFSLGLGIFALLISYNCLKKPTRSPTHSQCSSLDQVPKLRSPAEGKTAPTWFRPAGIASIAVGALAFAASAAMEASRIRSTENAIGVALFCALFNPLFFVGVPLGIYWLARANRPMATDKQTRNGDYNPQLTHCPDCGGHVSRLAQSCPHCGRPIASAKSV